VPKRLLGLPRTRSLSDPTNYQPFVSFSCGEAHVYERDVNDALLDLLDQPPQQIERLTFRVAEDRGSGELIGLSVFLKRSLPTEPEAVNIALIAVEESFRGARIEGNMRIGAFLLCDALDQIERRWGNPLPEVWASVHRENEPCKRNVMCPRHCFWRIRTKEEYEIYLRSAKQTGARGFPPAMIQAVTMAGQ
jgi:hypothetical protein